MRNYRVGLGDSANGSTIGVKPMPRAETALGDQTRHAETITSGAPDDQPERSAGQTWRGRGGRSLTVRLLEQHVRKTL